jgi:hypothetical protein
VSVITTSDEKITSAKKNIDSAIKDLSAILIDKEWGWDGYTDNYQEELTKAMFQLMHIREKL